MVYVSLFLLFLSFFFLSSSSSFFFPSIFVLFWSSKGLSTQKGATSLLNTVWTNHMLHRIQITLFVPFREDAVSALTDKQTADFIIIFMHSYTTSICVWSGLSGPEDEFPFYSIMDHNIKFFHQKKKKKK